MSALDAPEACAGAGAAAAFAVGAAFAGGGVAGGTGAGADAAAAAAAATGVKLAVGVLVGVRLRFLAVVSPAAGKASRAIRTGTASARSLKRLISEISWRRRLPRPPPV